MIPYPEVRRQLVRALAARDELADVSVSYGWPKNLDREHIVVLGVDDSDSEWASLGSGQVDDQFSILVGVQIRRPGDSAQESDDRAAEIVTVIRDVVLELGNFDGVLIVPAIPAVGGWENFPGAEGYVTQVDVRVRCRARS